MISSVTPPSMVIVKLCFCESSQRRWILSVVCGRKACPAKPGFTVIISTWRHRGNSSDIVSIDSPGFMAMPGTAPSWAIWARVRAGCG